MQILVALKRNDAYALKHQSWARCDGLRVQPERKALTKMADLEAYKDKFGESGQRVLQNALNESKRRDQNYIAVEHIISGLAKEEPDLFNATMSSLALDPVAVARAIENRLDNGATTRRARAFASRRIQPICSNAPWSAPAHTDARLSNPRTSLTCSQNTTASLST